MKIGAGGLQGMMSQDAAKGIDMGRMVKPNTEAALLQSEDPNLRRQLRELNKAVERMRRAAETYNQPIDFAVEHKTKPRIKAKDRRTGAERQFTLEEAEAWVEGITARGGTGKKLNGYV